jgi:hypothetical protein
MADLRHHSPAIQKRMNTAIGKLRHYTQVADVIAAESEMVTLLDSYRFTPQSYVELEIVLWQFRDRHNYPGGNYPELDERGRENQKFVNTHDVWGMWDNCARYEQDQKVIWNVSPAFW